MKKAIGVCLAVSLTVGTALSQDAPGAAEPTLPAGIKQFGDGDLAGAVFTLEGVIRTLAVEPALHAKELSQAYLYRGAAFVGLGQEENAKGSFAAALQYDKTLRIGEDKFSPRVVRVFEAARTGKTKSVLLPPSNIAKKGGIGALGIAGIVAGVAAIGGGVAAATHGSVSQGGVTISFLGGTPPAGSTISLGPLATGINPVQLTLTFSLTSSSAKSGQFESFLLAGDAYCVNFGPAPGVFETPFSIAAGQTVTITQHAEIAWPLGPGCGALPLTTNRVVVNSPQLCSDPPVCATSRKAFENVSYHFVN